MTLGYEQVLAALREAMKIAWHTFHIGLRTPPPADIRYMAFGQPRVVMPLRGVKHIRYGSANGIEERDFLPGEALICNSDVWCEECWINPHTMFSIVLRPDYLRLLTIDYRHLELPPGENPDGYFYHTPGIPPAAIYHTLSALMADQENSPAMRLNFQAFLHLAEQSLTRPMQNFKPQNDVTWTYIREFLDKNFTRESSREAIAAALKIHPATLSRVIRKNAGCGVTGYLMNLRLNYAMLLLQDRSLSVKEISDACGFNHENYFIRIFRRRFLASPGQYRANLLSLNQFCPSQFFTQNNRYGSGQIGSADQSEGMTAQSRRNDADGIKRRIPRKS